MQTIQQKSPFDRFMDMCKSPVTKQEYAAALKRFMTYYNILECEELLRLPVQQLEDTMINYIGFLKDKKCSEGHVIQQVSAVRKFITSNRINLNWDFINQHKGEFKRKQKDEAYSHEQIQTLLQICDIRTRCVVLLFSSTGIRIGALPDLKLKHLKRVNDLYEFTIYEGYNEEYITYCTPECATAIDNYLAFRQRLGEKISPESYLIRQQFDINDQEQIRKDCKPVTKATIRNVVWNYLIKSGIREVNHNADRTYRKLIPELHGFRKFFCSQLVNANLNTEKRWLLEGHVLPKNDSSYVRVKDELFNEYIKAIDALTINPENRLKRKVSTLEERNDRLDRVLDRVDKLEKELGII